MQATTTGSAMNSGRDSEPRSLEDLRSNSGIIDRDDPIAMLHERIERKHRGNPQQALAVTRNWSTVGFFECSPSLEQLRKLAEPEAATAAPSPMSQRSAFMTETMPRTAPTTLQSLQHARRPRTGDVYFRKQQGLAQTPTFEVNTIDESKSQAIDKSGFAVTFAELEDARCFNRAMEAIVGLHDAARPRSAPNLSMPPISKYTGLPARLDFFQLYKHHQADSEPKRSSDTSDVSPLTARVEFVKHCHEGLLPPVPFLARCTSNDSPMLNLSGQGVSPCYVNALSKSFEKISFLKHVNLSNNQLDPVAAEQLLAALRQQNQLESITLDKNRIGSRGITQLAAMICTPRCAITEISVADNRLTDVEVAALLHACLSITRTLAALNVRGNYASAKAAEACSRLLQCDDLQLIELDMSWNTLRGQGAIAIFQALAKFPLSARIQVLALSWNGVADGITKTLCALLSTQAVEVVRLDHNRLTNLTLQSLVQYLQSEEAGKKKPRTRVDFTSNLCSDALLEQVHQLMDQQ